MRRAMLCAGLMLMTTFAVAAPTASACDSPPGGVKTEGDPAAQDGEVSAWVDTGGPEVPFPTTSGFDSFSCGGATAGGNNGGPRGGGWGCRRTSDLVYPYDCHGVFHRNGEVCSIRWKDMAVDGSPWELNDQIYDIDCHPGGGVTQRTPIPSTSS